MSSPLKRRLKTAFVVILPTLFLCLLILEFGLRAIGRQPSNMTDGIFEQYKKAYRIKKNIFKISHTPSYSCKIITNSYGFRDKKVGSRSIGGRPFVVFIGESLTFGNGVDFEESFVGIYEQLADREGVDVVNLAIGGHRFPEQEEFLRDFLDRTPAHPSKVIIVFSPMFIEGFEDIRPNIVVKSGYIFNRDHWFWPYIRIMMGNISASYCFFRDNGRMIQSRIQKSDTAAFRSILSSYSRSNRINEPQVKGRLFDRIEVLDKLIQDAGAIPVHVYLPLSTDFGLRDFLSKSEGDQTQYDLNLYYSLLQEYSETREVSLISVFPALDDFYKAGGKLNFDLDAHYNSRANQIISESIYRALNKNTDFPSAATPAGPHGREQQ